MMYLKNICAQNFRQLDISQLELSSGINFFTGDNGAGKTSILEAIYFLTCCKSFRTSNLENVVAYNQEWLSLSANAAKEGSALNRVFSVKRINNKSLATVDGSVVKKSSQLSLLLPSLVMCSERQRLFIAPPQTRRSFLDWCVFHVKPESINCFTKYERILKQRNAAIKLKSSASLIKAWDVELIENGSKIIKYRFDLLKRLEKGLSDFSKRSFNSIEFLFDCDTGCGKHESFADAIEGGFDQDVRYGFTRNGPHRFDFSISANGKNVKEDFSRGQIKLLVFYLILAQSDLIKSDTGNDALLLFDDFTSDFSAGMLGVVFDELLNITNQTFIASVDKALYSGKEKKNCCLFHVEHGNVKKMI